MSALVTAASSGEEEALLDLGASLLALAGQLEQYLLTLDEDDLAVAERAIALAAGTGWRASPSAMANHLTRGAFRRWRYIELLSRKFTDLVEGRSKRQIWNLPARYGKSYMGSQWGPVWAFDRHPWYKIALTSYGDTLADENAVAVRDLLEQHADQLRVRLRRDRRRADRFVTDAGGGLLAAGVGSGLTGFGGHGIVVDDPFKNWQEAHSPARRLVVANWYKAVVRLRLETDWAWILLIMTRWHEEDLAGLLEAADIAGDGEGWEVVRLPAIAEEPSTNLAAPPSQRQPDPLDRKPGEVLEPERFSEEAVRDRARAIGSYLAAGMEQQRPSPEEGGEIKRAWWKWAAQPPPRYDASCTSWDTKAKDKPGSAASSYVVGQAWGRTGSDYWCVDQQRGQWNLVTTKTAIVLLAVRHPYIKAHVVENKALGPDVIDALRRPQPDYHVSEEVRSELGITDDELPEVEALFHRGMPGLIPDEPKGDKIARARAQSPLIEAGNVHLLEQPYAHVIVNEAAAFPNGAQTDCVDSLSQALKRLSKRFKATGASAAGQQLPDGARGQVPV